MTYRKIDVSGEAPVTPAPQDDPELRFLPIARLAIDDRYQRPITRSGWATIRKIAADFRWAQFAPVLVAPLPNGTLAIIDGQHRTHAAAICGYESVPCMIVPMDLADQARAFAGVNGTVTRITVHHVYKAALAAREDWAVAADLAVSAGDCTLMTYNKSTAEKACGEIFCIGLIRKLVSDGHGPAVTAVLKALRGIDGGFRVALYSDYILRPVMTAVASQDSFLRTNLTSVLSQNDPFLVLDRARRESGEMSATLARESIVRLLARAS